MAYSFGRHGVYQSFTRHAVIGHVLLVWVFGRNSVGNVDALRKNIFTIYNFNWKWLVLLLHTIGSVVSRQSGYCGSQKSYLSIFGGLRRRFPHSLLSFNLLVYIVVGLY